MGKMKRSFGPSATSELRLVVDDKTFHLIRSLKEGLGVHDEADVLRKSLALAKIVAKEADEEGMVIIRGAEKTKGAALNLRM